MPDKIINHVVIDGQSGKFYAPNVLTGLEKTDEITKLKSGISELKENLNDLESDGVAPTSKQMLSDNYSVDSIPYHFRKTASDNADREELEIVGGTVYWNQLAYTSQVDASKTQNGVTITDNRDGTYTVSTDANGATANTYFALSNANVGLKSGHKYLLCGTPSTGSANTYYSYLAGIVYVYDYGKGLVFTTQTDGLVTLVIAYIKQGAVITTPVTFKQQIFDLTAMFGSTIADYIYSLEQSTAGAGVALFKSLFPKDYYPYNAGELLSVSGLSEHKMVGFNQWDEEWELGYIVPSTGELNARTDRIRSKNYIPVLGGNGYYFYTHGIIMNCVWYDASYNYIRNNSPNNEVITAPQNAKYCKFSMSSDYGTTYNHDICINISDPARNGEYEPYVKRSYPLDSSLTLRGIPKLSDGKMYYDGDRYLPDGKVERRYGVVDLGTLTWTYDGVFSAVAPSIAKNEYASQNLVCSKYPTTPLPLSQFTYGIRYTGNASSVMIKDPTYTDAATFKSAMSGVMLVYELATPTTEEATPYRQLQICDPNGTEEFVSTGIVPVGHETRYPENLRAKIEGLPWDFSSLIAPTEKTTTASRNYTTGSLLIMGNVLYKVTANIANGGTITVGTNVTATTLSEILSALAQ